MRALRPYTLSVNAVAGCATGGISAPNDTATLLLLKASWRFEVGHCLTRARDLTPQQSCNAMVLAQGPGGSANSDPLATWTGGPACNGSADSYGWSVTTWKGVQCKDGRVATLDLPGLGASGPLEGLVDLTAITTLSLPQNKFSGALAKCCCVFMRCAFKVSHGKLRAWGGRLAAVGQVARTLKPRHSPV